MKLNIIPSNKQLNATKSVAFRTKIVDKVNIKPDRNIATGNGKTRNANSKVFKHLAHPVQFYSDYYES
jgi:hypothetical protein